MNKCKCPEKRVAANCPIHATQPSTEKIEEDLSTYGVHYQRNYIDESGRQVIERLEPSEITCYTKNKMRVSQYPPKVSTQFDLLMKPEGIKGSPV